MPPVINMVLLAIFFVWSIVLTILFFRIHRHYNSLIKGSDRQSLQSILDNLLQDLEKTKKDLANVSQRYDKIEREGLSHIQKIGLLRFNPFKDTGGDQSFILALVDATDTGVVISGLYSRSGTRWYAKKVVSGKGLDHEISSDERKALSLAKAIKR